MNKEAGIGVMDALFGAVFAITFVIVVWLLIRSRAKAILDSWAIAGGFQILDFKKRYLIGTGPFKWWTNSRNQIIYWVSVRDAAGRERSGWVRCGSYWGGVWFSNQAEVRWDEA